MYYSIMFYVLPNKCITTAVAVAAAAAATNSAFYDNLNKRSFYL